MSFTVQVRTKTKAKQSQQKQQKPSFRTAAAQQQEEQQQAAAAAARPSFLINRPAAAAAEDSTRPRFVINAASGSQRTVQTSGAAAASRIVPAGSAAAASAGFQISAAASGAPRTVASKRRSADVSTFTRTIANEDMHAAAEGEDDGKEAPLKRQRSIERAVGFAVNLQPSRGPIMNHPVPVAAPMTGAMNAAASMFRSEQAQRVANATADRLAMQQSKAKPLASGQPSTASSASSFSPALLALGPAPFVPVTIPLPPNVTIVLLRNLAPAVTGRFLLTNVFGLYDIAALTVDTDPQTQLCIGTAEVHFSHPHEAEESLTLNQNRALFGQALKMSIVRLNASNENSSFIQQQQQQQQQALWQQQQQQLLQKASSSVVSASNSAAAYFAPSAAAPATASFSAVPAAAPSALFSAPAVAAAVRAASAVPPTTTAAATVPAAAAPSPSPFSSANPINVGFVWGDADDATMAGDDTVFNITNSAGVTASSASSHASQPTPAAAASVKKPLEVRPKSVVLSGAEAMAGVRKPLQVVPKAAVEAVSSNGKPSITLSKRL